MIKTEETNKNDDTTSRMILSFEEEKPIRS